ncbi:MAG: hypothetical protein ATN33_01145 [Epulopiscium sp. Nele67-Bin001]|nr:MAG: hypothetical protein ATN33_01145 [Epulopiscium sp. Nele67-Bin001]
MRIYKYTTLVAVVILAALLMPTSSMPTVTVAHMDKFVHFGMFTFLTLTLCWENYIYVKQLPQMNKAVSFLCIFAVLTELLQYLSEYRTFAIGDIMADVIGITCGIFIANMICKFKKNRN